MPVEYLRPCLRAVSYHFVLFGTRSCLEGLKKRTRNGKLSASNDAFAKAVDEPLSGNEVGAA